MNLSELTTLVRASSRDKFVAEQPHLFLLITAKLQDEEEGGGFNTLVAEPFKGKRRSSPSRTMEVLSIVKTPGNPYPDRISIGRARNCDVAIRDPSVSKLHAHFRKRDDGKMELVDLDSQNGTCVNGRPLAPNRPEDVTPGDVLLFGAVSCKLLNAGQLHDLLK
jgi:hypothetical protein